MSRINYSKWDHIEVSDDEDDTHPNVDTPSLFRWRHDARIEREEKEKQEKARLHAEKLQAQEKVAALAREKERLAAEAAAADAGTAAQLQGLTLELTEAERQRLEFERKEAELERQERLFPRWNVDNMSKEKSDRTLINKSKPAADAGSAAAKPEAEQAQDMSTFFKANGARMREFGMLAAHDASHAFLRNNMDLVCEHLGSYLVVWAIDLEVEGKRALVKRVAHQCIVVQYIMELAKSLRVDPRACVDAFFARIGTAEKQYKDAFDDEFKALLGRIEERAKIRIADAEREAAAEERAARLGPAGLDPLEVLAELPAKMREAFETQNTPMLEESLRELPDAERSAVWARVVGSGLWVPAGGKDDAEVEGSGDEHFEDAHE